MSMKQSSFGFIVNSNSTVAKSLDWKRILQFFPYKRLVFLQISFKNDRAHQNTPWPPSGIPCYLLRIREKNRPMISRTGSCVIFVANTQAFSIEIILSFNFRNLRTDCSFVQDVFLTSTNTQTHFSFFRITLLSVEGIMSRNFKKKSL